MSTIAKTLPNSNQSGKTQDGSSPAGGTGGSGLTSVGITVPSFLNTGGSPLTANGTIIIGFSGSALPILNGGTGLTTLGTAGQVLTVNGGATGLTYTNAGSGTVTQVAASVPSFLSISGSPINTSGTLNIGLSGTALPTANGGTGLTTLGTNGQVLTVAGGVLTYTTPTTGTVTQVAAAVPAFLSISGSPINTTGTLSIGLSGTALPTANGGTGITNIGTEGQVLTTTGGVLAYTTPTTGTVTSVGITPPSFLTAGSAVTSSGNISLSYNATPLPYANGGTGLTTIGTAGQLLAVNVGATGLEYITSTNNINSISGTSPILVSAAPNVIVSTVTTGTGSTLALSDNPTFTSHVDITGTDLTGLLRVYQNTFTDTTGVLATFFNSANNDTGSTKIQIGQNSNSCTEISYNSNTFLPNTTITSFPGSSIITLNPLNVIIQNQNTSVTINNGLNVVTTTTGSIDVGSFYTPNITGDLETTDLNIGRNSGQTGVLRYYRNLGESTFQMSNSDGTSFLAIQGNNSLLSGVDVSLTASNFILLGGETKITSNTGFPGLKIISATNAQIAFKTNFPTDFILDYEQVGFFDYKFTIGLFKNPRIEITSDGVYINALTSGNVVVTSSIDNKLTTVPNARNLFSTELFFTTGGGAISYSFSESFFRVTAGGILVYFRKVGTATPTNITNIRIQSIGGPLWSPVGGANCTAECTPGSGWAGNNYSASVYQNTPLDRLDVIFYQKVLGPSNQIVNQPVVWGNIPISFDLSATILFPY
jgi:hypothetical protein